LIKFIRPSEELIFVKKITSSESTRRGMRLYRPLIFQCMNGCCHSSVGFGTITHVMVWLPRLQRAVPSVSLDKSEYLICGLYHGIFGCVKGQTLVITRIFYAHKSQEKKPNLSREFHEFSRIGFYNPCELAKFAAEYSGFGALNDGYGLVGNHQSNGAFLIRHLRAI